MKNNFSLSSTAIVFFIFYSIVFSACSSSKKMHSAKNKSSSEVYNPVNGKAKTFVKPVEVDRQAFVNYAKTLLGTPYLYGSTVPSKGLDCSGFVYNVFQHFGVSCPRVTRDYTNEGKEVSRKQAKPGDIILFTGSDNSSGIVGHMGIITENDKQLMFVHSASGKNVGVILNALTGYYETHFVKIISVLK